MFAETEYFYLRFGVLSLLAVWIAMWCYIDTKWLIQIVEMEQRTKSPLSSEGIGTSFDTDSVLREIENADSDDDDGGDSPKMKEVIAATVDVEKLVRRRKREQKAVTRGIEQICDSESMSDSAELFMDRGVPKTAKRETPRPPPRRKDMKMGQQQDEDEELYRCNLHYGIATDRGSSTKRGDEEKDESKIKMRNKGIAKEYSTESSDFEQIYREHAHDAVTKMSSQTTLTAEGEECPD